MRSLREAESPFEAAAEPPAPEASGAEPAALRTPGDLVIGDAAVLKVSVAAGGMLRIGRGAQLHSWGSAAIVDLAEGARVQGHLESRGPLRMGRGSSAGSVRCAGPLLLDGQRVAASVVATEGVVCRSAKGGRA